MVKKNNYPPYFCQNEKWTAFWEVANGSNHQIISWQNLQIYEYPWEIFGRRIGTFWYIPKARMDQKIWLEFIDFVQYINHFKKNKPEEKFEKTQNRKLNRSESENKKDQNSPKSFQNQKRNYKIDFIKIDFDSSSIKKITAENVEKFENRPDLLGFDLDLEIAKTNQKILKKLQKDFFNWKELQDEKYNFCKKFWNSFWNRFWKIKIVKSDKKIQYLQATTVNLEMKKSDKNSSNSLKIVEILEKKHFENLEMKENLKNKITNLVDFYEQNLDLWQSFNERVRRYSRKVLGEYKNGKYLIITDKTEEVFEDFYDLHWQTSVRQNFPTQSKKYLHELFWQDFVFIIVIKKNNFLENTSQISPDITNLDNRKTLENLISNPKLNTQLNQKNNLFFEQFSQELSQNLAQKLIQKLLQKSVQIKKHFEKNNESFEKQLENNSTKNEAVSEFYQDKNHSKITENLKEKQKLPENSENKNDYNSQNSTESVFLGLVLDNTLTYLLGGNSESSLKNHTQYLLQIQALALAKSENCQFYDMGGWENGSGYGEFKNGYRGNLRTFFGPFDINLLPFKYRFWTFLIKFAKKLKKIVRK